MPKKKPPQNITPPEVVIDPFTGEVLVVGDYSDAELKARQAADIKAQQLLEQGYVRLSDAARMIGIDASSMVGRNKKIIPDDEYLTCGLPPTGAEGERTVKGSELRWCNPSGNLVLLHPEYVVGMADAEEKTRELQTRGYIRQPDAAKMVGIDQDAILVRSTKIDPNKDYLPNGLPPTGDEGEVTVKGSELKWQSPYNQKMVLLHPEYVAGMRIAEEEEKELIKRGYIRQADAVKMVGVEKVTMSARSVKIDPNKDYLPNGLPPTGAEGEVIIKGSEIRWVHPYNQTVVLLHPEYVGGIGAAEKKARELKEKGYLSQADASRKIGISQIAISTRCSEIKPDKYYLPSGASPDEIAGKEQIKGSELRWHHPYSNQFLLHPDYVAALEAEYADKEPSVVKRGAKTEVVGKVAEADLPGNISDGLRNRSEKERER